MTDRAGNMPSLPGIFPDQMAPVVRHGADGRELGMLRWGFPCPPGVPGNRAVTNIRNTGSSYWRSWMKPEYRCIVPVTAVRARGRMTGRIPADHVRLKRVYAPASADDGARVLVDRLWPRGVSKARAALRSWCKDVAPSTELREWFGHDPARWEGFCERYRAELKHNPEAVEALRTLARQGPVTLLFAARDETHNEAVVLRDVLLGR